MKLSDGIQKVVSSGSLGAKLFGFAYKFILQELFEVAVSKEMEAMPEKTPIKEDAFFGVCQEGKGGSGRPFWCGGLT